MSELTGLKAFLNGIREIRNPDTGCPWDLAQDHESLMKYFHEELHEFEQALREKGPSSPETWEELGDVLLQVLLHAQLAEEKGYSNFDRIAARAAEKLIERHPHVFDPQFPRFKTAEEVSTAWEQIKAWAREKNKKSTDTPVNQKPSRAQIAPRSAQIADVPKTLPALTRAARMGEKAASFGFDWPDLASVEDKVAEEYQEWREAAGQEQELQGSEIQARLMHTQEEFGDLLFSLAQYARKRNWDPETLLQAANEKFLRRFEGMERAAESDLKTQKKTWESLGLEDLEKYWKTTK